jgi:hypothetical protein
VTDIRSEKTRRPASVDDIDVQIAKLKEKRKQLQIKRTERIAKAIMKAAEDSGLNDVEIPDEDLKLAFGEIVGRFRSSGADASVSPPA